MIIDAEDYIQHHGVKGMRWGFRKTPEEIAASRKARAEKYIRKAAKAQGKIEKAAAGNSMFKYDIVQRNTIRRNRALDNAQAVYQGDLTKRQKRIAIGAASAATTAAAYGTYHTLNSGNARRLVEKGKARMNDQDVQDEPVWNKNPDLARPGMTEDDIHREVVAQINPDYGDFGTKMNCRRATYAYEMRRRGYDVKATKTPTGMGQDASGNYNATRPRENLVAPGLSGSTVRVISELNKTNKPYTEFLNKEKHPVLGEHEIHPSDIFSELSRTDKGARGELGIKWQGGGAHSMSWENVNGKVVVFDNQTGKKYTKPEDFADLPRAMDSTGFTRLDDKELNNDFLLRWLKNA